MSLLSANPSRPQSEGKSRALFSTAIVAVLVALSMVTYAFLTSYLLRIEEQTTPQRAGFFAASMDEAISRLEHLPYVMAIDPVTLEALKTADPSQLNPILAEVAARARAEFVYVLDLDGKTIASSNYQDDDTLVGNLYTFRPYFRDAVVGGQGRFYAVGVTTGRPGYFIAEPVRDAGGEIFGVVAVKIGIADLSRELSDSGELVFVTNSQGVVLASSKPDLIYGVMSQMSAVERRTLEDQQQFGEEELFPLDWAPQSEGRARLNGTAYVWTQSRLGKEDWTLHLMSDVADLRRQALLYVTLGLMAVLTLVVAAAIFRAAQLRNALTISDADRRRLATEIEDRKIAEAKLEAARSELLRKDQLAALGQLSASITHELGQPISAMRNYLVAEEIATGAKPGSVWPEVSGLVDRMQRILDQLRLFGRTTTISSELFGVQDTVHAAYRLVRHTANAAGVNVELDITSEPLTLKGQPQRFEQVIVNLLRNAIDAAADLNPDNGHVRLSLVSDESSTTVRVSDNGAGLGDLEIADMREPFFSTKPSGKGMGLGLAISGQIVNEMGGTLQAENQDGQGAVFLVTFPRGDNA